MSYTQISSKSPASLVACAAACLIMILMVVCILPTSFHGTAASALQLQDEPVARAGPDQNVTVGDTVILNGSASSGYQGAAALNYTWNVSFGLFGGISYFYLYGENVSFLASDIGLTQVNLTVRDNLNRTAYDDAFVIVKSKPPTYLEKNMLTIVTGAILSIILVWLVATVVIKVRRGDPIVSPAGKEKFRLSTRKTRKIMSQLLHNPMGFVGMSILVFFILMAAFGPTLAPFDVHKLDLPNKYKLPDPSHWLGRDNLGIDIFSELLVGAQTSIIVGIFSALIASLLGAGVGLYSGYVGGWKDEVIMRMNDIVLSIPWLVLMIIVAAMVGKIDLTGIILIIGLTGWSTTARMVRAQVLSVKERQYIERARAIGASEMSIIRRHIFPNTFPLVFANTILTVAVSILSEATLSFLGLRPVNVVTWGTMLSFASGASAFQIGLHWWILAPGLCIVAVVLGFTLLGYALDEILNPKLRRR